MARTFGRVLPWVAWRVGRRVIGRGDTVVIPTPRGATFGVLHAAEGARAALVMAGGAGGGIHGPAGIYEELAESLLREGVAGLRHQYRMPNRLAECVADVLAALEYLRGRGVERAALVGWSFGGAVVIEAGARSEIVVGVATVASQTYGTGSVGRLAPKALLLLHGTADRTLSDRCSRDLYARAREPKELVLYPADDHGLTRHSRQALEKLLEWSGGLLSASPTDRSR